MLIGSIKTNHDDIVSYLGFMGSLFRKGYSPHFLKCSEGVGSLIKQFNVLSRKLHQTEKTTDNQTSSSSLQFSMLGILSLLSQLIHDNPTWTVPLTKRFTQNVLMLDARLVADSLCREQIVRTAAVIYSSMSSQLPFLKENHLLGSYKEAVLALFSLASDPKTLIRLSTCLSKMMVYAPVTSQEAKQYQLSETIGRFIGEQEKTHLLRFLKARRQFKIDAVKVEEKAND